MAMGQWLWLAKKCYIHQLASRLKKIASLADAIGTHNGKVGYRPSASTLANFKSWLIKYPPGFDISQWPVV
jgi:hypothetical protein